MKTFSKEDIASISDCLGLGGIPSNWSGLDVTLPLLERIREDGAVIVIKLDGERTGPDDTGPYTVIASGKPLGDKLIRTDARTIEEALCHLIGNYADHVWGITPHVQP